MRAAPRAGGKASARGKYTALRAGKASASTNAYAGAILYLSDTLDWMNPYEPPAAFTADIDADISPPQDQYFPHL